MPPAGRTSLAETLRGGRKELVRKSKLFVAEGILSYKNNYEIRKSLAKTFSRGLGTLFDNKKIPSVIEGILFYENNILNKKFHLIFVYILCEMSLYQFFIPTVGFQI